MKNRKMHLLSCLMVLFLAGTAAAQQIYFPNFSSAANLKLNGKAQIATFNNSKVLRLTSGPGNTGGVQSSTVWFQIKQPVSKGFTTYFKFQIHNPATCCQPGDGIAFVVQNSTSTDATYGATGAGATALGVAGGGMGYAGIPNSVAVEFDTSQEAWDPTANHVAVQSCSTNTNGPVHNPGTYTIGNNHNVTSCLLNQSSQSINSSIPQLGMNCANYPCANGKVHQVVIEYTPPAQDQQNGTLQVWIDPQFISGTHTPVKNAVPQINVPYNIATDLSLDSGNALVGFTGSQTTLDQVQDVFAWEFTPHTDTTITQPIQDGGTQTTFSYGGHTYGVTYPCLPGDCFKNDPNNPILMSVDAMLIDKATFYNTRLKNAGPPFSGEQCITYYETGGNCVVYRVTCSQGGQKITCPTENSCSSGNLPACIAFKTSYYPADIVTSTNADYIKDPTEGGNQWQQLLGVTYQPNVFDGTTSGRSGGTSDFVATIKVHQ